MHSFVLGEDACTIEQGFANLPEDAGKARGLQQVPATVEQLRRWALELAEAADRAEWGAFDPGDPEITRTLFEIEDEGR